VRRIDGTSRNPKHRDLITKGFQVSTHLLDPQIEEARHIFAKEPSGSENGKTADHFRPEVTVICRASSLPGTTEGLAREASAHEVNGLDPLPVDASYVVVTGHGWPMLFEDLSTVLVNFDLPGNLKTGSLKSKIETPYSRKQTADLHALSASSFRRPGSQSPPA